MSPEPPRIQPYRAVVLAPSYPSESDDLRGVYLQNETLREPLKIVVSAVRFRPSPFSSACAGAAYLDWMVAKHSYVLSVGWRLRPGGIRALGAAAFHAGGREPRAGRRAPHSDRCASAGRGR